MISVDDFFLFQNNQPTERQLASIDDGMKNKF